MRFEIGAAAITLRYVKIVRQLMRKKKSSPGKSAAFKNIDEYLAAVAEPARSTLKKMRAIIRDTVPPETIETISYGIPTFKYKGSLIWFAAFSDHCSLFPTASVIEAFQEELKSYETSKGTIRFPVDKPLPTALLKKLVKARVAQVRIAQIKA
jgi:uncharacterized protein YdhG (YjbR/CyaY superfamily)